MEIYRCVNCMCEISEGEAVCHHCGYDFSKGEQVGNALRRNSILRGRYLVGNVLGQGGFGITYIGYDLELDIRVAIKEYYPAGMVMRDSTSSNELYWNYSAIELRNQQSGIERFVQEARKMAKLDQIPSIVRVRDSFRENKTAYIVMDFVEGVTLKEYLLKHGVMDYASCVEMLGPVIESLSHIHKAGLIHRDISPDNIMIQSDGTVRLLDMGAAVDLNTSHGGASMTVAKTGFSAPEQYMENGRLGSWTDVYAMCATIYYCLSGKLPPEAMERMMKPELAVVSFDAAGDVPEYAAACLQKGMDLKVENRLQTMDELYNGLTVPGSEPPPVSEPIPVTKPGPRSVPIRLKKILLGICAATAAVIVFFMLWSSGHTWTDEDGNRFVGKQVDGVIEGPGSCEYANGDRYEGDFVKGLPDGEGTMWFAEGDSAVREYYEGEWSKGKRSGTGTMYWLSGEKYEGEWSENTMSGTGTFYYADGNKYEGKWLNGKKNGAGKEWYSNGDWREGMWIDGVGTGKMTYYWANGSRQEGTCLNGVWHGLSIYYKNEDDSGEEWVYENDERLVLAEDAETWTDSSGNEYTANFVNGKIEGVGSVEYINGDRYFGNWEGFGVYIFEDGSRYEAYWKDGEIVDGEFIYFYENGDYLYGVKEDGKTEGTAYYFYADGTFEKWEYQDGELVE